MQLNQGIVLSKIRYSETSLILNIFTLEEGTKAYLFPGGSRKNKRGNALQPFTLISFKNYGKGELQKISEIESIEGGKDRMSDPIKNCVTLFLSEILMITIRHQERDDSLYYFLRNSILLFDQTIQYSYFPSWFLINFSRYLGFFPNNDIDGQFLDYLEGSFVNYRPNHQDYASKEESGLIKSLIGTKFDDLENLGLKNKDRNNLLKTLLAYYANHIEKIDDLRSLEVLETVLYD
jgi:DNA repair protein RecO (recombination protein O)